MRKSYYVNGKIYDFTDVHIECGILYGRCTTSPYHDKWAWLDSHGFQIERQRRIQAVEVIPTVCDNSYTIWGGEFRDILPYGVRYYQRGRW